MPTSPQLTGDSSIVLGVVSSLITCLHANNVVELCRCVFHPPANDPLFSVLVGLWVATYNSPTARRSYLPLCPTFTGRIPLIIRVPNPTVGAGKWEVAVLAIILAINPANQIARLIAIERLLRVLAIHASPSPQNFGAIGGGDLPKEALLKPIGRMVGVDSTVRLQDPSTVIRKNTECTPVPRLRTVPRRHSMQSMQEEDAVYHPTNVHVERRGGGEEASLGGPGGRRGWG
ncbi:hypothetical protein FA13DRAFT_1713547 [Coprinellus micaceus]|uniref:Uncharacterized protein n=1 Tax=Coprinellus micaceus TaxID=71717 RepID=A0A4Y7SWQ2_COPMI|nr:hypothetical protein FA13DRAFT_1713547 [Coprinellus micaceus]